MTSCQVPARPRSRLQRSPQRRPRPMRSPPSLPARRPRRRSRPSPADRCAFGRRRTTSPASLARSGRLRGHEQENATHMADISAAKVKELRERTGAGFMDCKNALVEAEGDLDKATAILRERGLAAAAKKSSRDARDGLISSYIHFGGKVGVLIEVNCETDFVARTDEFQKLVKDIAVQVAGMSPL